MRLRPLYDRVIVQRIEVEEVSNGGIILPGKAAEKPVEGHVLAVGSGNEQEDGTLKPLGVKVGDRVLFGKYHGYTVKIDGEELLVMKEDDLMAVLR